MERCYACDRPIKDELHVRKIFTSDNQMQYVGVNCFNKVRKAGDKGWQPPKGGPRLFETKR